MIIRFLFILMAFFQVSFAVSQPKKDSLYEYIKIIIENRIQDETNSPEAIFATLDMPTYFHEALQSAVFKEIKVSESHQTFQAIFEKDGSTIPLTGTYTTMQNLPVLKEHKKRGAILVADDITFAEFPANKVSAEDIALDVGDLIGLELTNSVNSKQPISKTKLKKPCAIHQGQVVDVVYQSAHVMITTRALAKQNGAVGDDILLEPIHTQHAKQDKNFSHKTIHARVIAPGKARIIYA